MAYDDILDILARQEEEERALQQELQQAQGEAVEARHAAAALLIAVEAAMAPLMQELAAARRACGDADLTAALGGQGGEASTDVLEAEVKHLEVDITHYQEQVEILQTEERRRVHELRRLQAEVAEANQDLAYEKQRARHFEAKRELAPEMEVNWAGIGPSGIGRRTMEVRAEQSLREAAEQRAAKLSRDISRLAVDTATQQAVIEQLGRRLAAVRKTAGDQDGKLADAMRATAELHRRLRGEGATASEEEESAARALKKNKTGTASTGRLPHLSF